MFIQGLREGRTHLLDEEIPELKGRLHDRLIAINHDDAIQLHAGDFVWKVNHRKNIATCLRVKQTREKDNTVVVVHNLGESNIVGDCGALYHLLTVNEVTKLAA